MGDMRHRRGIRRRAYENEMPWVGRVGGSKQRILSLGVEGARG